MVLENGGYDMITASLKPWYPDADSRVRTEKLRQGTWPSTSLEFLPRTFGSLSPLSSNVCAEKGMGSRKMKASEIATLLALKPHPDGGFYLETFRDFCITLPKSQLPPHCKHISLRYYLLGAWKILLKKLIFSHILIALLILLLDPLYLISSNASFSSIWPFYCCLLLV